MASDLDQARRAAAAAMLEAADAAARAEAVEHCCAQLQARLASHTQTHADLVAVEPTPPPDAVARLTALHAQAAAQHHQAEQRAAALAGHLAGLDGELAGMRQQLMESARREKSLLLAMADQQQRETLLRDQLRQLPPPHSAATGPPGSSAHLSSPSPSPAACLADELAAAASQMPRAAVVDCPEGPVETPVLPPAAPPDSSRRRNDVVPLSGAAAYDAAGHNAALASPAPPHCELPLAMEAVRPSHRMPRSRLALACCRDPDTRAALVPPWATLGMLCLREGLACLLGFVVEVAIL